MRRRQGRGAGSPLPLILGCLAVLGATFALGVVAGRVWPSFPFGPTRSAATDKAPKDKVDRRARDPEPTPKLTFYQELTAPLTSPPPAKPPKAAPSPAPAASVETPPPTAKDSRFTVQLGAYEAREPAESLRARLAAAGYDAYIVDGGGRGGTRFRVRVGAFATREAAQEFADRIAADRSVSTFVTTR